ncbi:ribonuclease H-like domain-containing protein, partial [Tanacetum coccineum]
MSNLATACPLHTFSIFSYPKKSLSRLKGPKLALVKNGTWLLVPRPTGVNIVHSMWLFKHKFHAYGTLSRYKARLVANGSSHQLGVDFDEMFSLVVKPATIHTVLSLVMSRQWPIHQLDVKNAFLNGDLSETVYMHQPPGLFLSQKKYALQLLKRAHMVTRNPSRTPVDTDSKLGPKGAPTLYCSLAGGLNYLTFSRPDLSYVGTLDLGLRLYASSTTSLVGYIDADWAGCPSTRGSTLGYCQKLHCVVIFFVSYTIPLSTATLVYCDNVSAVYMSANPVQHQRTKHIEIDIHFIRDMVTAGQ